MDTTAEESMVENMDVEEEIVPEEIGFDETEFSRPPDEQEFEMYTIKKGDTLQKVSYKFYGTHKKWKKIFDANDDVLKDSNSVYPGMKIKVPLE